MFLGKYKNLNIDTLHVLKCKISNRKENFKSVPDVYREMLIAWTNTESVQQILHEPLHGNVNTAQNTKTGMLIGCHINLVRDVWDFKTRKEGNVLFNDALNTFYLQLYGVGHMVKDHSDSERGNLLQPHGLLVLISSKGSFICIIP